MLTRETKWISSDPESKIIGKQDNEAVETIFFSKTIGEFETEMNIMVDIAGAWAAWFGDFNKVARSKKVEP